MATRPNEWKQPAVVTLTLPSGNQVDVRPPDIMSLVLSDQYTEIPNGMLEQVSRQFSGNSADREITCHSGLRLPDVGEPVQQGSGASMVRGRVVSVRGEADFFVATVSLLMGSQFKYDPENAMTSAIRFGGNNQAVLVRDAEARWKPTAQEFPQMGRFTRLIVCSAVVEPKIVETVAYPEKELAYSSLSSEDRQFIFEWAMPTEEVRPAEKFSQEPSTNLPAAPDVQGIWPDTSG